uniref:LRRCT domain-containing protein n=1 Tax=Branchiostoma floridae TaxID=7739 RepID=C3Z9M5_BRAFL|eukprot:XP_002594710.1 hypothetical protein BRAFLDRAFT_81165 [Branchiostoma floridae]
MTGGEALLVLLLISNRLYFVVEALTPSRCTVCCYAFKHEVDEPLGIIRCFCPNEEDGTGPPCSWIGHGGTYSFPMCLDSLPTCLHNIPTDHDDDRNDLSISIRNLWSSTILEGSFSNYSNVYLLQIHYSNVSTIQPGAFRGLSSATGLHLDDNRISCLALRLANLQENRITTINDKVLLLNQTHHLRLEIENNELNCNKNLEWFICSLPELGFISNPESLKCASPAELRGTLLSTLRSDVDRSNINMSRQRIGSVESCDDMYLTAGTTSMVLTTSSSANTLTYNEAVLTEDYTEAPYTSNVSVSVKTTEMDYVVILPGDRIRKIDNDRTHLYYLFAMSTAIVIPLLFVFASVAILSLCNCCDAEGLAQGNVANGDSCQNIEPYAVCTYAELQASDRISATDGRPNPTHDQTLEDSSTIQPYAVTYMDVSGKGKNGKLPPYATTTLAPDQASENNDDIQPYAVTYMDVSDISDHDEDTGPQIQPYSVTYDEDPGPQIQPYSVTHDEDPGPQLQPYSVTHDEDPGPHLQPYSVTHDEDPGPQLQPYSVTHDEDPGPQLQPYSVTHDEDPGPQLQPYSVTHDEDPGPQIQPYSVTHDEDPGPQLQPYSVTHDEDPGPHLQPYSVTHDEDPGPQLQPYSVTHDEDPGPQIQPYSVTHDEDPGPQIQPYSVTHDEDPGPQIQPYSVTHDEDPGPQLQPYSVTHDEDPGPQIQPIAELTFSCENLVVVLL